MTAGGHGNTYSTQVPAASRLATAGDVQTRLGRRFGATLLAVRSAEGELVVSPPWDRPVQPGTTLYYVARERLGAERLFAGA
jgi:voltage-gated potassium channel